MSKKSKLISLIIIGLVIIGVIIFLLLGGGKRVITSLTNQQPQKRTLSSTNRGLPKTNTAVKTNINKKPIDEKTKLRQTLAQRASDFAEKIGSYSNQTDFKNLEELKPIMTKSWQAWADGFMRKGRASKKPTDVYQGTTSKALKVKTMNFDMGKGQAEFMVTCQRSEFRENMEKSRLYYQDIKVKFVKEEEEWKVDGAWWQT